MSGIPKSTYDYYHSEKHLNACKNKQNEDDRILELIKPVFEHHKGRYGYRRIMLAIPELKGINHKRIQRIMSENGLLGKQPKQKYHSYKGDNGKSKSNLLLYIDKDSKDGKKIYKRDFSTTHSNEKWATDVSEFKVGSQKLYLSPIMDMHDDSIVSYDISRHPDFKQTKRMLDKAFVQNDRLDGLVFHSDRGWQYQMRQYQYWLKEKGIKQSFSRKGNCMDNSLMENFFGIMKNEMYYNYEYNSIDDLEKAMHEYIEYYNTERINIKRKGLTPLQVRYQSLTLK